MLDIRFFDVPQRLAPFIERAVMFDLTRAVGTSWQFLPTGCFGVSLVTGTIGQDYTPSRPGEDGAFSGVPAKVVSTSCREPCLALGLSLTPLAVLNLPLHTHDFETCFALPNEAIFGSTQWSDVRARVRDAPNSDAMMFAFMGWMEEVLDTQVPAYGRSAAIAEAAHLMRLPQPPSVQECARRAGVQRRQFERDFRRHFGTSPKRYARIARVQQVGQLSWQGLGLAGIAAELGFTDQAHMCHAVKDVTGMSPSVLLRHAMSNDLVRATRPYSGGRITHF